MILWSPRLGFKSLNERFGYRKEMGNKMTVISVCYSDDTCYLDDAQLLIGC